MPDDRKPWYRKFAKDWLGDAELRLCGLAARGLLADLMDVAHGGNPYGYVTRRNGDVYTEKELCEIIHVRPATFRRRLAELLDRRRVEKDTDTGLIFIGRMVRDHAREEQAKLDGRKGGNPDLQKKRVNDKGESMWELTQKLAQCESEYERLANQDPGSDRWKTAKTAVLALRKAVRDFKPKQ